MSALGCSPPAVAAAPTHLEWVPCNLCSSWDAELLYPGTMDITQNHLDPQQVFACTSSQYGRYGPVMRCSHCDLVYLNPRLSVAAVESAYEEVADQRYLEEREGRVHTFARALDELEQVAGDLLGSVLAETPADSATVPGTTELVGLPARRNGKVDHSLGRGRLLDVGCHIGVFLELAAARGWVAEGVEPSRWASEVARARGLRVTRGTLRGAALPSAAFDVVTLWDVIEHFPDPGAELREVHRLLRPGGLVGITTMQIDSPVARLLGARWPWLMQMHLYYFSVRTLSAMLERCGFEVVKVAPHRRIVRLAYLLSRTERWSPGLAQGLQAAANRLGFGQWLVPVDLGDIFTLYARRTDAPNGRHHADSEHGRG